jgi:hypothetical protein
VIPVALNGGHFRENIKAACKPCNRLKGALSVNQFMKRVKHASTGDNIEFLLARFRRRVNLQIIRSCNVIRASVGLPKEELNRQSRALTIPQ